MRKNPFHLEVVSVRLVKDAPIMSEHPITSPETAVSTLGKYMSEFDREIVCVVNLKNDGTPINCSFVSTGCLSEAMAHTVYFRFLRLLIIVPMGSIAFSTMGGNRTVNHTVTAYCKYFLSVTFEAVTMALAIIVCNAFINAGLPSFTGSYSDWAQTLIYLCEMTFTIELLKSICK